VPGLLDAKQWSRRQMTLGGNHQDCVFGFVPLDRKGSVLSERPDVLLERCPRALIDKPSHNAKENAATH
jgi:hypothetical protein